MYGFDSERFQVEIDAFLLNYFLADFAFLFLMVQPKRDRKCGIEREDVMQQMRHRLESNLAAAVRTLVFVYDAHSLPGELTNASASAWS